MTTDKHDLLDKCTCGAGAGFDHRARGCAVQCTECAEGTPVMGDAVEAMVVWNRMIRAARSSYSCIRKESEKT